MRYNKNRSDLVWYTCYGSNLLRSRFLCYIRGGTPRRARKAFRGCTNRTSPAADEKCFIRHRLYFAGNSLAWGDGGVAFIESSRLPDSDHFVTRARKYLITEEQFLQVVRQENGLLPEDPIIDVDFSMLRNATRHMLGPEDLFTRYGRIINLGETDGLPVFTFTAKWDDDFARYNAPGDAYLRTIIEGLKESHDLADERIIDYLAPIPGIEGHRTREELKTLTEESSLNY